MLATGGGDSLSNLWHDCIATDKEEALLKEDGAAVASNTLKELNSLRAHKIQQDECIVPVKTKTRELEESVAPFQLLVLALLKSKLGR